MNSIAVIVKHMAGNMQSRWTDFLTSDGEKPGRDRDAEFSDPPATREALLQLWEDGWQCVLGNHRVSLGCRSRPHHHHSRRSALGDASHQPAGSALLLPLRPDRISRQTSLRGPLADFECAPRQIRGIQPASSSRRSEPALRATNSSRHRPACEFPAGSRRGWDRACARRSPARRLSRR